MKRCPKCGEMKDITQFNKDKRAKDGHYYRCRKCHQEATTKYGREVRGSLPMSKNKDCSSYLGIAIAERLIGHLFNDVQRMPNNNPGFDFICAKDKKIDVKSSCITLNHKKNPCWRFSIKKNQTANYFLLLAFNSRADLEPLFQWLIPGNKLNELTKATISTSTINKWDDYKRPIGPAVICCNTMKEMNL